MPARSFLSWGDPAQCPISNDRVPFLCYFGLFSVFLADGTVPFSFLWVSLLFLSCLIGLPLLQEPRAPDKFFGRQLALLPLKVSFLGGSYQDHRLFSIFFLAGKVPTEPDVLDVHLQFSAAVRRPLDPPSLLSPHRPIFLPVDTLQARTPIGLVAPLGLQKEEPPRFPPHLPSFFLREPVDVSSLDTHPPHHSQVNVLRGQRASDRDQISPQPAKFFLSPSAYPIFLGQIFVSFLRSSLRPRSRSPVFPLPSFQKPPRQRHSFVMFPKLQPLSFSPVNSPSSPPLGPSMFRIPILPIWRAPRRALRSLPRN